MGYEKKELGVLLQGINATLQFLGEICAFFVDDEFCVMGCFFLVDSGFLLACPPSPG